MRAYVYFTLYVCVCVREVMSADSARGLRARDYIGHYFNNPRGREGGREGEGKDARANLRIRVTKIIARIKSDYFTARHTNVRYPRAGGRETDQGMGRESVRRNSGKERDE